MRIKSRSKKRRDKYIRLQSWHPWFAWKWVKLIDSDEWVWLETVYRKGKIVGNEYYYCDSYWGWVYRDNSAANSSVGKRTVSTGLE